MNDIASKLGAFKSVLSSRAGMATCLAFGIAAYMIFMHLGLPPLVNPDEGRNASVGMGMMPWDHWFVPTYDGLAYLDKPSFFFKLVAFSVSIFGRTEFAARLPSALFAMGALVLVFKFCRREYDLRSAILAVIIVATSPLFLGFARYVIFDMTLAFFVSGAIFAGYLAEGEMGGARKRCYWLSAACMGAAMLVKGPVGFIVPMLVLTVFNMSGESKGAVQRLLSGKNILIVLAVFSPWFIGACIIHPDFLYYGVIRESFLRFTTNEFHRHAPFYLYPQLLLATTLFWSFLMPQGAWNLWKNRRSLSRADRLMIVWPIVVVLFFSVSQSKLPGYVLSAVLPLGILVARIFAEALENGVSSGASVVRRASVALFVIATVGAVFLIAYQIDPTIVKLKFKDQVLTSDILASMQPLIIVFLVMAIVAIAGVIKRDARISFLAFLIFPLIIPCVILPVYASGEAHRSDNALAMEIQSLAPGADIAAIQTFPPGLPFYSGGHVILFTEGNGNEIKSNYIPYYLATQKEWPEQIVPLDHFNQWFAHRKKPVFLITERDHLSQLKTFAAKHRLKIISLTNGEYSGLFAPQGGL